MRKQLVALALVYVGLGVFYLASAPRSGDRATTAGTGAVAGRPASPHDLGLCTTDSLLRECNRPDPYLLTWDK